MELIDINELKKPLSLSSIRGLVSASKGYSGTAGSICYINPKEGWGVCQSNNYSVYTTEALFCLSFIDGMKSDEILEYLQEKYDEVIEELLSEYFTIQDIENIIEEIEEDCELQSDIDEIIYDLEDVFLETKLEIKNYIIRNYVKDEEEY